RGESRPALENPVLSVHRTGEMIVEPHASETGVARRDRTCQHLVDASPEWIEEQVDLHAGSMADHDHAVRCGRKCIGRSSTALQRKRCDNRTGGSTSSTVGHQPRRERFRLRTSAAPSKYRRLMTALRALPPVK